MVGELSIFQRAKKMSKRANCAAFLMWISGVRLDVAGGAKAKSRERSRHNPPGTYGGLRFARQAIDTGRKLPGYLRYFSITKPPMRRTVPITKHHSRCFSMKGRMRMPKRRMSHATREKRKAAAEDGCADEQRQAVPVQGYGSSGFNRPWRGFRRGGSCRRRQLRRSGRAGKPRGERGRHRAGC